MPRYIRAVGSPLPRHDKLLKRLAAEFTTPGSSLQPLILEEHLPVTRSRHVQVIWDSWEGIPDEQRSALILEAYRQAEGTEAATEVSIAEGSTPREALALGLLPYKVVPARRKHDGTRPEDYDRVFKAEARNTLLGARARELRYARLEDAEQAAERLEKALPGSSWAVVQELTMES